MTPAPKARKPHWIVPTYFQVRAIAYAYAALFLGLFFWQQGYAAWAWWLMGAQLFVYPYLMYRRALHSQHSQQAELQNLVMDAALWGAWCAAFGFPLWISYTLFITSTVNNAFSRGLHGLRDAVLAYLAGATAVWFWVEPRWAVPESPWVIGLCVVGVSTYLVSIARIAHIRTGLLRQAREALKRSEQDWRLQANQDALTGLFNRRYFDDTLSREIARAEREGSTISLMVLDVDHFKRINDSHGHDTGDEVLRLLGQHIGQSARQGDVACRLGGEEFCVLYPGMSLDKAYARAEQLRQRLAQNDIPTPSGPLSVTASIGLAEYPSDGGSGPSLLAAADQALYAAKRAGRDRVLMFQSLAQERLARPH
jgi:diguanylate cyclase